MGYALRFNESKGRFSAEEVSAASRKLPSNDPALRSDYEVVGVCGLIRLYIHTSVLCHFDSMADNKCMHRSKAERHSFTGSRLGKEMSEHLFDIQTSGFCQGAECPGHCRTCAH